MLSTLNKTNATYPGRVARNPAFRENNELGTVFGGFSNKIASLLDCSTEIKPSGLGLRYGHSNDVC
jgi:hypothetical protein